MQIIGITLLYLFGLLAMGLLLVLLVLFVGISLFAYRVMTIVARMQTELPPMQWLTYGELVERKFSKIWSKYAIGILYRFGKVQIRPTGGISAEVDALINELLARVTDDVLITELARVAPLCEVRLVYGGGRRRRRRVPRPYLQPLWPQWEPVFA